MWPSIVPSFPVYVINLLLLIPDEHMVSTCCLGIVFMSNPIPFDNFETMNYTC